MGNALHTQRLARAVQGHANDSDGGDIATILQLLQQRPALLRVVSGALGGTVWHWAAAAGDVLLLEALIRLVIRQTEAGAVQQQLCQQLDQAYHLDTTPLMLACQRGHADAARILLQHGADPHLADRRGGNSCLHKASYAGHTSLIEVILDTRATFPLLLEAGVVLQQHPAPQQQRGVLLDKGNLYELTALHMAVCGGRAEAAAALLEAGASLVASSKYPALIAHLDLPHRTTPLHAAVAARNMPCILVLLTAHEQRYGGTAAGTTSDPRRRLDGRRQLPWQLAHRMQLPEPVCRLLHPSTPLREALSAQQQQQQQDDTLVQPQGGVLLQQRVLCRSLQELAGAALKEALLSQLHCVAAAAGVDADKASGGGQGGGQQHQQQHQQPEGYTDATTAEAMSAAAAELLLALQESVVVCVSITQTDRLCMQLIHAQQQHSNSFPHAAAAAVDDVQDSRQGATAQLLQQSLWDIVRLYILCHGVCDPGEPSNCWFAAACPSCTAVACASPLGKGCSTSSMVTAASSSGDCNSWSLRDSLQCSCMTAAQCSQLPGATTLEHSRLAPLLRSMESDCAARWSSLQAGGSWREACGVCFEEQGLLLQLKPCKHVLCMNCVKLLIGLVSSKPALCPFCRNAIAGVHVHVGGEGSLETAVCQHATGVLTTPQCAS